MNDRQYDPYAGQDPYAGRYAGAADQYAGAPVDQYEVVGYDEYGQPVYQLVRQHQVPPQAQPSYDAYAAQPQSQSRPQSQSQPQGYGYDPYASGALPPQSYDAGASYDAGVKYDAGQQGGWIPQQQAPQQEHHEPQQHESQQQHQSQQHQGPHEPRGSHAPQDPHEPHEFQEPHASQDPPEYRTEQFSFIEEPDEQSEDVIDWLKFTESRTERREEAKRRGRSRVVALVVVLVLAVVGGVGYLWAAGDLPGQADEKSGAQAAAGPQKRDVVVVHLHNTKGGGTSTALLVNNTTTKRGTTVLLPNSLAMTGDDGTGTTLAKSVEDDGSTGTREAIDTALGTHVEGTWRLDTPYLNNLVELVGNIDIDTDADVPDPKAKKKGGAPLVKKGEQQTLSGPMAVAYATYRAPGEAEDAQLTRFGQVVQGVLRKLSSDPQAATVTVQSLAQILDPSLKEKDLGSFLARLADRAKGGDYATALLPVRQDGTLSEKTGASVVKDVLGGAVKSPEQGAAVRVGVKNATGDKDATQKARIALVNGGYTFVDSGTGSGSSATSQVTYADAAKKAEAQEVAKTLGLPAGAVREGEAAPNADVSVVLGGDY
ncbi:LCP family protein [Streptomyces sp. NPDC017940]|uniref:LCP family protein n=1 Tax=Streptomyces sp. NPDC017940 TaxID=3365017 RepID=UPI00378A777D